MKKISCSNCSSAIKLIDLEHNTQVSKKLKEDKRDKPINPKNLHYCPSCGVLKYVRKTKDKLFNVSSYKGEDIHEFFIRIRQQDRNNNEETLPLKTGINYTQKTSNNINTKSGVNSPKKKT